MVITKIIRSPYTAALFGIASILFLFAGTTVSFSGVSVCVGLMIYLAFKRCPESVQDETLVQPAAQPPEPALAKQAYKNVEDDVGQVPLSVLGFEYRRAELAKTEVVIDSILQNCVKLIKSRIHTAHTIAILLPTADGGYRIRSHISESDHINEEAIIYPGKGVIGSFLKDGLKQLILQDIVTDSMTLYYYKRDAGIRSLMASPIMANGAERGTIIVDSTQKKNFTDEDHAFLSCIAEVCGQAVYYTYLYNEHRLAHIRLIAMSNTEKYFFEKHDLNDVFDKMAEIIPFAFPCDRMTISLRETESENAVVRRAWGVDAEKFLNITFSLSEKSLASLLYEKNMCMYRNLSPEHYEIRYHADEPHTKAMSSFLAFPLGVDSCKGLILLESVRKDSFSSSSRDLLSRLVTSADIAIEKIQIFKRTENIATHDGLTGLFNHRQFQQLLKESITRSLRYHEPLALVLCDIDFFKKVNDTWGHRFGDLVLKTVAGTLGTSIREGIDVAARYGGEEFTLILEKSDAKLAFETADRIRNIISQISFQTPQGKETAVTMSFGIAIYGQHGRTQEALIQHADKALYAAKKNGRNRVEMYFDIAEDTHKPSA